MNDYKQVHPNCIDRNPLRNKTNDVPFITLQQATLRGNYPTQQYYTDNSYPILKSLTRYLF